MADSSALSMLMVAMSSWDMQGTDSDSAVGSWGRGRSKVEMGDGMSETNVAYFCDYHTNWTCSDTLGCKQGVGLRVFTYSGSYGNLPRPALTRSRGNIENRM